MFKTIGWTAWAIVPVAVFAWWAGPGQAARPREDAAAHLRVARVALAEDDWAQAASEFAAAAEALPEIDEGARRRLALEEAKAAIQGGDLWQGINTMEALLDEVDDDDSSLARSTRYELATSRYFAAWLMRLEGATSDEWRPEALQARQHFRMLAETAEAEADVEAFRKNVESVIRLEQMDLAELEALPLPKNCPNCKNCRDSRSQCKNGACQGKKPGDGRKKVNAQGAGKTRAEGSGS